MQVFRLMNLPDRVIAFDELPESLVSGFEMCRADGFPRHWKEWMGKKKKVTPIPPEKDLLTGQVRRFDPIVEEDHFFYLVDWNIQPIVEKWQAVCDYVRSHVDKEIRLMDKITDMAVKLAPSKSDGVMLEPEEVPVIPILKTVSLVDSNGNDVPRGTVEKRSSPLVEKAEKPSVLTVCDEPGCKFESEGPYSKNAVAMHKMKKHKKEKQALPV